jgi:hypothetical protein
VRGLFRAFVLLVQEVSFGGIQRRVERQPQLQVEMHQSDKLFFPCQALSFTESWS